MRKSNRMRNPVIVLGLYFPGIDILKNFKKKGIDCIGIDHENAPGHKLLRIKTYNCPDPIADEKAWINYLIGFQNFSNNNQKPVILNTSDIFINAILNNTEKLSPYFFFHGSANSITQKLMNKATLAKISYEDNIPIAKTIFFSSIEQIEKQSNDLEFPVLIRPEFGKKWTLEPLKTLTKGEKLLKANSKKELINTLSRIKNYDDKLIIQELIHGPDENLFYLVCYINKKGKCLGYFLGQKLRLTPIHFGSATYMRTCKTVPFSILKSALKLLSKHNYHGPAGVEFKKDEKDGKYKIVEINTRFGLWDIMGKKVKVDLFNLAYLDLIGENPNPLKPAPKEKYWLSLTRDITSLKF